MTYAQARERLIGLLREAGWAVTLSGPRGALKLPYATSPNGRLRLWFKPQAVHYTMAADGRHERSTMHTVAYGLDIRKEDPRGLVAWITKRSQGPVE